MSTSANESVSAKPQADRQPMISLPNSVPVQTQPSVVLAEPTTGVASDINDLLFKLGIEPSLTVREAAAVLRWSYWKARRYFSHIDGICVCYRPKRYKRPYRMFTIPVSIFAREWQKMTGRQPESTEVIRQRLLSMVIRK